MYFRMSYKLYKAIATIVDGEKVKGTIQLDSAYPKMSLNKGYA